MFMLPMINYFFVKFKINLCSTAKYFLLLFFISVQINFFQIAKADSPSLFAQQGDLGVERREERRLSKSMAHYSRARALLLSAIQEFDRGRELADPSVLIKTDEWRAGLVSRAQQLEKVLAPQSRESGSTGVRLQGDQRLIARTKP
jgi:hypothetical protein